MNRASISVVIPMYNAEKTIETTLLSIVEQDAVEYIKEILVINDGSFDSSPKIVSDFSKKRSALVKLINKENGGVSSARNLGLAIAEGTWIAFCDSDDIWVKDKIRIQVEIIDKHQIDLLGGNYLDKPLRILSKEIKELHKASTKELCIKMFPQTSTIIMRKSIYGSIGGFDESMSYYEDGDYLLKIVAMYNYYYSPIRFVIYGGERECGGTGLSANTQKMNEGSKLALYHTFKRKDISIWFYLIMRVFYVIKSVRRSLVLRKNQ